MASSVHEPHWYGIPFRVALTTFLLTLLSFAVSLLLGIIGVVLAAKIHAQMPNMTMAYRKVAFPVAMAVGAVVLIGSLIMEVREYRRDKAVKRIVES